MIRQTLDNIPMVAIPGLFDSCGDGKLNLQLSPGNYKYWKKESL